MQEYFGDAIAGTSGIPPTVPGASIEVLGSKIIRTPCSSELGDLDGRAGLFGRCDIHRVMMRIEQARFEKRAQEKAHGVRKEIEWLDDRMAQQQHCSNVAKDAFNKYKDLENESFKKRHQIDAADNQTRNIQEQE